MSKVIPVLRVFDYAKTIEFYINWLGFEIKWEHKPEGSPFYLQVVMGDIVLDLTEHHGDCSPGAKINISSFENLKDYHEKLSARQYKYMHPGLGVQNRELEMIVIDPFYNRLCFYEQLQKE